jgi:hypothetical protein
MTPEQERFYKRQDASMRKYHSKKNTAARRAARAAQTTNNNERDNTLFLLGLIAVFGVFAFIVYMCPV